MAEEPKGNELAQEIGELEGAIQTLVLNPFPEQNDFTFEDIADHPDMVKLAKAAEESLIKGGNRSGAMTKQMFAYALLRCKYDIGGKWVSTVKAYRIAYGRSDMGYNYCLQRANDLEKRRDVRTIIDNVRERVIMNVMKEVTLQSVGFKANRINRMGESWERLQAARDAILPSLPKEKDFPSKEKFEEALAQWREDIGRVSSVWTLELSRIEKMMLEIENTVADELGQRSKKEEGSRNLKGYIGIDPEKV